MRRCYLVCYDICDPKRLNKVRRLMKGYGKFWQYSVYFCVLRAVDRVRMQARLEQAMNLREDRVMITDLGEDESAARDSVCEVGQRLPKQARNQTMVV